MKAIREPAALAGVADPAIRAYLGERLGALAEAGETYAPETHGWFLLVEPGDDPDAAQAHFDCFPLLASPAGEAAGHGPFEWISDLGAFYEGVILMSDGGDFVGVIVPKAEGVDRRLLALCAQHAVEAPPEL